MTRFGFRLFWFDWCDVERTLVLYQEYKTLMEIPD